MSEQTFSITEAKVIDVKNTKTKTDKNIYFLTVQYTNEAGVFTVDVSNFGHTDLKNGDVVNFEYEVKGDFKNVKGEVTRVSEAQENIPEVVEEKVGGNPPRQNQTVAEYNKNKSDDIHFQVCLKIASEINKMKDSTPSPKQIVDYAKELMAEAWK